MNTLYLGMGCFWSAQCIFKTIYPELKTTVGYTPEGIEVLELSYSHIDQLDKYLGTFFENHSFTLIDVPEKYKSVIYYSNDEHYPIILLALNHFNQKIKLSGKLGQSQTKIEKMVNYVEASEQNQNYLDKHPTVKCVLGFNGVYY